MDQESNISTDTVTSNNQSTSFGYKAAKGSWISVLVFMACSFIFRTTLHAGVLSDFLCMVIIIAGLLLGITALFYIPKLGTKRILTPALIGIALNLFFVWVFVGNFIEAHNQALHAGGKSAPYQQR
jgi:hypothetical protein